MNGRLARFDDRIGPEDKVLLGDAPVTLSAPTYILLNKPKGVITAVSDAREKTVMSFLPENLQGLFPVGRLDRDTRGLLLFTEDGDLAHRLLHPGFEVNRTYRVKLGRLPDLDRLQQGVELEEGVSRFDNFRVCGKRELIVELHEGWKRQIRRTFDALGCSVEDLVRTEMAGIKLGELAEGEWRELEPDEVRRLKEKYG